MHGRRGGLGHQPYGCNQVECVLLCEALFQTAHESTVPHAHACVRALTEVSRPPARRLVTRPLLILCMAASLATSFLVGVTAMKFNMPSHLRSPRDLASRVKVITMPEQRHSVAAHPINPSHSLSRQRANWMARQLP